MAKPIKLLRYKFTEHHLVDGVITPTGRIRTTTARSEAHARYLIGQYKKSDTFWAIEKIKVIDLDHLPPGFGLPSWLLEDTNKNPYRNRIGHCQENVKHKTHAYRNQDGKVKFCTGELRGTTISERKEVAKPNVTLEAYRMFKNQGGTNAQIAKYWGVTISELHEMIEDLRNGGD